MHLKYVALHEVYTERVETASVLCGISHASAVSTQGHRVKGQGHRVIGSGSGMQVGARLQLNTHASCVCGFA